MSQDIKEKIVNHRIETQKIDAVREDSRFSDEGKQQAIYKLYSEGLEQHQQLVEQYESQRESEREKLHKTSSHPASRSAPSRARRVPGVRSAGATSSS